MEAGICKRIPPPVATRRLLTISVVVGGILGLAAVGGFRVAAAVEIS